jgi:hypothetical protein
MKYADGNGIADTVASTINDFVRVVGSRFDNFDADSSALIQLVSLQ